MAVPSQKTKDSRWKAHGSAVGYSVPQVLGRTAWLLTAVPAWYLLALPFWHLVCVPVAEIWQAVCWTVNAVVFLAVVTGCGFIALTLGGSLLGSIDWPKLVKGTDYRFEMHIVDERPGGWIRVQEVKVPIVTFESEPTGPYW